MRRAGKEIKLKITEAEAKKAATSVNENSRQRIQLRDYGSGGKNVGCFRK